MSVKNITKKYFVMHKAHQENIGKNYIIYIMTIKEIKNGQKIKFISSVVAYSELFPNNADKSEFKIINNNTYNKMQIGDELEIKDCELQLKTIKPSTSKKRLDNIIECLKVYINQIGTQEDIEIFKAKHTKENYSNIVLCYKHSKDKHFYRPLKNLQKHKSFKLMYPKKDWEARKIPKDIKQGLAYIEKTWKCLNQITSAYSQLSKADNDKIYCFMRYIEDFDYDNPHTNPIMDILLNNNKNKSKNKLFQYLDDILKSTIS